MTGSRIIGYERRLSDALKSFPFGRYYEDKIDEVERYLARNEGLLV